MRVQSLEQGIDEYVQLHGKLPEEIEVGRAIWRMMGRVYKFDPDTALEIKHAQVLIRLDPFLQDDNVVLRGRKPLAH